MGRNFGSVIADEQNMMDRWKTQNMMDRWQTQNMMDRWKTQNMMDMWQTQNMVDTCQTQSAIWLYYGNVDAFNEFSVHKKFEVIGTVHVASFSKDKQHSRW